MLSRIAQAAQGAEKKLSQTFSYFQETGQLVDWPALRIVRYTAAAIISHALPAVLMSDDDQTPIDIEEATRDVVTFLQHGLAQKQ
ncbi:hypothetical protein [Bifidobacterium aquikefiricola]|uniref:TetR family transcriptional regulator n=1 Tax=Bifidobacterium aquikefiricola TaxID=3059038 RepID=A0AB39U7B9_9BIFI